MLTSIWFGGDDAIVKYWDVTSKIPLLELSVTRIMCIVMIFHLLVMKSASLGHMISRLSFRM